MAKGASSAKAILAILTLHFQTKNFAVTLWDLSCHNDTLFGLACPHAAPSIHDRPRAAIEKRAKVELALRPIVRRAACHKMPRLASGKNELVGGAGLPDILK